eukprot:5252000-Amphidinium_carterae.1
MALWNLSCLGIAPIFFRPIIPLYSQSEQAELSCPLTPEYPSQACGCLPEKINATPFFALPSACSVACDQ